MKILFKDFELPYLLKDSEYPVGGWAVELSAWIEGIVRNSHDTGVLTWQGASDYVGKTNNFDLLDTYDPKQGLKILKYFYYFIPTLLKVTRKYKPDIIIQACCGLSTGIMAFIANQTSVPFVYRVANDMDADERYKMRLKKYEQMAYRYGLSKASAILCQNQYQLDCFKKQYPNKPLYILHNPINIVSKLTKIRPKKQRSYFAWLGIFSKQKNMSLLYKIAKNLQDVEFKVAGMPHINIDNETLSALTKLKQLKNVDFVGYLKREKIGGFLAKATALLSTSDYEGFSNTFLEAFVNGTPVIAPLRVDPDQIITRNKLGMTSACDLGLQELVRQLKEMEPDTYVKLSKRCYSYVIKNHTPESKARELIDILKSITDSFS